MPISVLLSLLLAAALVTLIFLFISYQCNKPEEKYYIIKFKQFKALYIIHPEAWRETEYFGHIYYTSTKDNGYYRKVKTYRIYFNFIDYYRYKIFMFIERYWAKRELSKDLVESFQNDIETYKTKSRKDLEERKEKLLKEVEEARKRLI